MKVTLSDFQAHCLQYILNVKEDLTILDHGLPVARLSHSVAKKNESYSARSKAVDQLMEFGKHRSFGPDMTIREAIEEGRSNDICT